MPSKNKTVDAEPASFEYAAALEREAATREILQVISRSRDDEQLVFDVILENAQRLCKAPIAGLILGRAEDSYQTLAAQHGAKDSTIKLYRSDQVPMDPEVSYVGQAIYDCRVIHLTDMADSELYRAGSPYVRALVDVEGIRTILFVPLIAGDEAIGAITLFRHEVAAFDDRDIALVQTFAEQAVIAIENVHQFRELQARLKREAATREILEVISRSRADDVPVFDVILENATRLCEAPLAYLQLCDPDRKRLIMVAHKGARSGWVDFLTTDPLSIDPDKSASARAFTQREVVQVEDLASDALYYEREPHRVQAVETEGVRTFLAVPLISDAEAVGIFTLYRREVAPFSDDDVALVQSFAAQAVIAIENVRHFKELQNRLEREAATREILQVISQSRENEAPVFDIILKSLMRLCDTPQAALYLVSEDCQSLEITASRGKGREELDRLRRSEPILLTSEHSSFVQAYRLKEPLHIEDIQATARWRSTGENPLKTAVELANMRTVLQVPLMSGEACIGVLCVYRNEIKPYTEDEITLHRTFAAQAVIAIENVRQFKALQVRTEEVQALNETLEDRVEEQVGELERMGRLKQFLSPAVADALVNSGDETMLASHRALIATLFCDIRGFTAFCETAEPEETIEVLQTYHEEMGNLISAHGGGVDKRMGDGIMVIFNDPLPSEDPAGDAVRLAVAMRERMMALCKKWKRLGHRLGFGVGISFGYATIGMVGSEGRYDYTASGTAVNMAARLSDRAEDGEILLSPRAYAAVEDEFKAESSDEVSLKGIREPVEVFRLIDSAGAHEQQD